jgi:hypothetical protein
MLLTIWSVSPCYNFYLSCRARRGHSSEDRVGMMMSSALRAAGLHPLPLRCGRRAPPRPAVTAVSAEPDRGRAMSAVAHGNLPILSDFSPKSDLIIQFCSVLFVRSILLQTSDSMWYVFSLLVFILLYRFLLDLLWIHTDLDTWRNRLLVVWVKTCLVKYGGCCKNILCANPKKQLTVLFHMSSEWRSHVRCLCRSDLYL